MEYRPLGHTGLMTSVIGLGCSRLGASVFEDKKTEAMSLLHYALDHGINFFDTADSYGYGNSERTLGQAFRGRRDKIIIATKGGFLPSSLARLGKYLVPFMDPFRSLLAKNKAALKTLSHKRQNFDVHYLRQALESSLRRLKTDYIDLYQLHSPPRITLENEEIFHFLDRGQREGKIRFYGISVNTIEDGLFCLQHPNVAALQVPINILEQRATTNLLPKAFPRTGIIARVPLARGFLTDKATVQTGLHFQNHSPSREQVKTLLHTCRQEGRNISDVAIQFLLQFKEVSSIIVGTNSLRHLRRNILASQQPALNPTFVRFLTSLEVPTSQMP